MRILWRTSPTRGRSTRFTCVVKKSIARACGGSGRNEGEWGHKRHKTLGSLQMCTNYAGGYSPPCITARRGISSIPIRSRLHRVRYGKEARRKHMKFRLLLVMLAVLAGGLLLFAQLKESRPVTEAMLRNPAPGDWPNWRRTDNAWGYSPLDQITRQNV